MKKEIFLKYIYAKKKIIPQNQKIMALVKIENFSNKKSNQKEQ